MKRLIFALLAYILTINIWSANITLPDEDLNYKVMYKWGLINSQAGRATLSLRKYNDVYKSTLVARTEPWADKIYRVRDTLFSTMSLDGFVPIKYEKIAHEDDKFSHDIINYVVNGNDFIGNCTRLRQKDEDKPMTTETRTLNATGTTVDMLSVFYYLRTLDFPKMRAGTTKDINIFSGKKKELLKIKYEGFKSVEIDDKVYHTYHVSFKFTTDDGKKSSDDIDTWISADNKRIPIKLEGRLPIGKIRCLYIDNK